MPQSNEYWTYDIVKHRWIPTILGCSHLGDITNIYADEVEANRTLESISRTVYNWAYRRSHTANKDTLEHLFAFECAEIIKEAILAQVEADILSGINDVKKQHGVNVETGMMMKGLNEHSLCMEAQDILMASSFDRGNIKFPLIVQYDWGSRLPASRYVDWGY